ncbi:MAG: acyltransferase [Phycisphaerae bacterium]
MNDHKAMLQDPKHGLRGFLVLDTFVRLLIWTGAMTGSLATLTALGGWPQRGIVGADWRAALDWALAGAVLILLFNTFYVALLVVLRLPIPQPAEGRYSVAPGKPIDRQLVWSCLIATLTKARYEAPFPGFLVFHVSNLPPMCWLMGPIFGPRSRSCYVTDPMFIDPHMIEVGRNVVFGLGAIIAGHAQGREIVIIKKTVIEDDVIIGGNAIIYDGCRIGRGAVILGGAVVRSDTTIGENEVWGGVPAKMIKTLPPYGEAGGEGDEISV